jgi:glutathionyl-hydroquinone reductase
MRSRKGFPRDEAAWADAVAKLSANLDVYEVILSKQKFLAGDVHLSLILFSGVRFIQ